MARNHRAKVTSLKRVFGATKGRILVLLCKGRHTVAELAALLEVTDNTVRAQLQRLERDGLVLRAGSRQGIRRPHAEYQLSSEALKFFPRAYEPLLKNLVDVLKDQFAAGKFRQVFVEAGTRLLRGHFHDLRASEPRERLAETMRKLNGSSFGLEIIQYPDNTVIRSCSCPLASVTATHPELCQILASVVGGLLNANVRERCEKGESPRCCFELVHRSLRPPEKRKR
jgi:predicted ArsR family transcriptional regulator